MVIIYELSKVKGLRSMEGIINGDGSERGVVVRKMDMEMKREK